MSAAALRHRPVDAVKPACHAASARLSTDYLNRHSEALMLLEMVPMERGMVADLRAWRAIGYCEHFADSQLRCAEEALAAYRSLDKRERAAFESLCAAMNRLILTVTALLEEMPEHEDATLLVEVAGQSLRRLIARATGFINANGASDDARIEIRSLQAEIDALMAR